MRSGVVKLVKDGASPRAFDTCFKPCQLTFLYDVKTRLMMCDRQVGATMVRAATLVQRRVRHRRVFRQVLLWLETRSHYHPAVLALDRTMQAHGLERFVQSLIDDDQDVWTVSQCSPGDLKSVYGIPMGAAVRLLQDLHVRLAQDRVPGSRLPHRLSNRAVAKHVARAVLRLLEVLPCIDHSHSHSRTHSFGTPVMQLDIASCRQRRAVDFSRLSAWQRIRTHTCQSNVGIQIAHAMRLEREGEAMDQESRQPEEQRAARLRSWASTVIARAEHAAKQQLPRQILTSKSKRQRRSLATTVGAFLRPPLLWLGGLSHVARLAGGCVRSVSRVSPERTHIAASRDVDPASAALARDGRVEHVCDLAARGADGAGSRPESDESFANLSRCGTPALSVVRRRGGGPEAYRPTSPDAELPGRSARSSDGSSVASSAADSTAKGQRQAAAADRSPRRPAMPPLPLLLAASPSARDGSSALPLGFPVAREQASFGARSPPPNHMLMTEHSSATIARVLGRHDAVR